MFTSKRVVNDNIVIETDAFFCGICLDRAEVKSELCCHKCAQHICVPCAYNLYEDAKTERQFGEARKYQTFSACPFCEIVWMMFKYYGQLRIESTVKEEEARKELELRRRRVKILNPQDPFEFNDFKWIESGENFVPGEFEYVVIDGVVHQFQQLEDFDSMLN